MEQLTLFDVPAITEWIYVGARGGQLKIGTTKRCPAVRAKELNITLLHTEPGGRARERELHRLFREDRIDREWFLPGPYLLAWVTGCHAA